MIKLQNLGKRAGFLVAIAGAAAIGGATTAIVTAAIPSTADGKIHACYRNSGNLTSTKGSLRVLDNQASPAQTCSAQETALSWDANAAQGGSGPVLRDANGQVLGQPSSSKLDEVYIESLHRYVELFKDSDSSIRVGSDRVGFSYTTTDCSGTAHVSVDDSVRPPYYEVYQYKRSGPTKYITIPENATKVYVEVKSSGDGSPEHCQAMPDDGTSYGREAYPMTEVSLPFNVPVALPLRLQ